VFRTVDNKSVPGSENMSVTLPRSAVESLLHISSDLHHRMRVLMLGNKNGALSAVEKSELETVLRLVHVCQMILSELRKADQP
jgi:hypothetical protein